MTDETETEHMDPMAKAVAHGFKEPAAPSRADRIKRVFDAIDHAMKHNSPVAIETRNEIHALLAAE